MGSIKELTALPMLVLMGALMVSRARSGQAGLRGGSVRDRRRGGDGGDRPCGIALGGAFRSGTLIAAVPCGSLVRTCGRCAGRCRAGARHAVARAADRRAARQNPGPREIGLELQPAGSCRSRQPASAVEVPTDPRRVAGGNPSGRPEYLNQTYVLMGVMSRACCSDSVIVRRRAWGVLGVSRSRCSCGTCCTNSDRVDRCEATRDPLSDRRLRRGCRRLRSDAEPLRGGPCP